MDPKIVGNRVFELRQKKGITQQQLANLLAISSKTVSKWESGRGLPDITTLPILASTLGVSIDDLNNGGKKMYEYKTEIIFTGINWLSDKADKADVAKFNEAFAEHEAEGWELVTYSYMATTISARGALLVTFRKAKAS